MWDSLSLCLLVAATAARTVVALPQQGSPAFDPDAQNFNVDGSFWWLQGQSSTTERPACPQNHDCVPEYQCVNGVIDVYGVASLDLRTGSSNPSATTCSGPEGSNNVCCRVPDDYETGDGTVAVTTGSGGEVQNSDFVGKEDLGPSGGPPSADHSVVPASEECEAGSECTPFFLCHNGEINVDGGDLLDVRIKPTSSKTCVDLANPGEPGVCCRIPGYSPSVTTPPVITSAPLTACPSTNVCVYSHQCNPDGTANTDGTGVIDIRTQSLQGCYLSGTSETGVCCLPPPPPVLDSCPGSGACTLPSNCIGNALNGDFQLVPYTLDFTSWAQCSLSGTPGILGICCENPVPSTPAPLVTCPNQLVCVFGEQCAPDGSVITDGTGLIDIRNLLNQKCYLSGSDNIGVCCRPPTVSPPVVDVCPGSSVCIPDILCTGDALDSNQQFVPYDATLKNWALCSQFGGLNSAGVCCANPVIPTPPPQPSYPAATTCGIRNEGPNLLDTRITSLSTEAKFGEFPWQAIIFLGNYTFKCGATLIGERWLLTAAHCVRGLRPADVRIRLGEWQVNSYDEPLPYIDVPVQAIFIHPRFNPRNIHNDVAVIEIAPLGEFSYHINAVCLPRINDQSAERFAGKRCFATGWGRDAFEGNFQHVLKKIDLPVVGNAWCQALLRNTRLGRFFVLHNSFMCAGGEENKDACKGDGGGPLVCEDDDGFYRIVGITAWGIGCGTKDVPGVYADVAALSQFIYSIIGIQAGGSVYGWNETLSWFRKELGIGPRDASRHPPRCGRGENCGELPGPIACQAVAEGHGPISVIEDQGIKYSYKDMWPVKCVLLLIASIYGSLALPQQETLPDVQSQCGVYSDCVALYLCKNGVIVTDGTDILDLRVKHVKCVHPEHPGADFVCCLKPGAKPPPATCPTGKKCVHNQLCKPDGTISTDGSGLLDLRTFPGERCSISQTEVGVCCFPPIPVVHSCPGNSLCLSQCLGQALDNLNQLVPYTPDSLWTQCPLSDGSRGVCCQPTVPSYDVCPDNSLCLPGGQCTGEAYDYTNTWAPHSPEYPFWATCPLTDGTSGVCCQPTIPSYDVCPDNSLCLPGGQCTGEAYDYTNTWAPHSLDYSFWATCPLTDGTSGVCCQPTIPSYDVCPDNGICIPGAQCTGESYDYTGTWLPYIADYRFWSTCSPGGGGALGVCCQPAIPSVNQCPENTYCFSGQDCGGQAVDYAGNLIPYTPAFGYWTQCSNNLPSGGPGVCCVPPPVDICPETSVCTPNILCIGQGLDVYNRFHVYDPFQVGAWANCEQDLGGLGTPGVCCLPFNNYPVAETCGVRNGGDEQIVTRITGRNPDTSFGEFPWQALVFFSNYTFKCGSTLIGDKWVLTAAHCVSGLYADQIRVRLGEWEVNAFKEPKPYVDVEVKAIHIHPEYVPGPVYNNVAVIELASPVTYDYHINRVCLGNGEHPDASAYAGKRCWSTGWGKDAFSGGNYQYSLKKVDLPILDHNTCQNLLRNTRLGRYFVLHKSFLCAGGEENKDACRGDGGGPLVCEENGRYTLVGITSWGIGCGTKDIPGVYADVAYAHTFINSVLTGSQQYVQGVV
ncbi:transmembrane protease serine 9-like [Oratosquilla oratoria]|uniref:transmembrane protease serine 9-like n=1 Tax=Oratosquilla oratoria TaxID=337810 RepID=UPI003F7574E2